MWPINAALGRKVVALAHFRPPFPGAKLKISQPEGALGRMGSLEVRLARGKKEIKKAQRLRYEVFYREGGAVADAKTALTRRDVDPYDKLCDHLIVIDHDARGKLGKRKPRVVGVYRLLRGDAARAAGGFYSATEYDLAPLLERHQGKRILELGRSCVLEPYRGKRTIELLWRGLLAYLRHHRIDVLIGCASLPGADPAAHRAALGFLAHHAQATEEWRVRARGDRYVPMRTEEPVELRAGLEALSPLIKGYLRVGAKFGDGAVVDRQFNTTDVFVVLPVADMDARYLDYFGPEGRKRAA